MTPPPRLAIPMAEREAVLERAKAGPLSDADYAILKAALATLGYLTELLEDRTTTLQRLRHLLFGARTETTRTVLSAPAAEGGTVAAPATTGPASAAAPPPVAHPGHGRTGVQKYRGAHQVQVPPPRSRPGIGVPHASGATSTRSGSRPAWSGWWDRRRSGRRSTRWSGFAATCAARSSRPRPRRGSGPQSTMPAPAA